MRTDLFCKQAGLNLVYLINIPNISNTLYLIKMRVTLEKKKKAISKNVKSQFVNGGLHVVSSLLLCDINVKFNWILQEHPKFVSEAYLSNLSLYEDQMPHDLQPWQEKDII